jgi:large subunit ribosomal protein L23
MKPILKEPIITEKYTRLGEQEENKQYAFEVDPDANKLQIREAIEEKFNVKVQSVRTMIHPPKRVNRYTRTQIISGKGPRIKRAVVTLEGKDEIDLFENI